MTTAFIEQALTALQEQGLKRRLRTVEGAQGPRITIDGKEYLNFCSNNYLGLADDPRLKEAAKDAIDRYGFGSGASRLVCGNASVHVALEEKIALFKGAERCLLFGSGYMANVGIITSLFGRDDVIFSDRLNHASIVDGVLLSQAKFRRYPHNDMEALEVMLRETVDGRRKIIITDSVFSMDGDIAPLDRIVDLAGRYGCMVMVDEAHAFGVMGKSGKGLVEHFGLENKIDIQMGTLSKAAGSFGAYVCGSATLIEYLINTARSFIYTTALPPSTAAASLRAVEIIEHDTDRRQKLWENTRLVTDKLKRAGFNLSNTQTPIIPIIIGDAQAAVECSERLLAKGIFVSAIRPPTVPQNTARLRVTVMATHIREDLETLVGSMEKLCRI